MRVQPGNRFVSCRASMRAFVRACARSGCLVEFDLKRGCRYFCFSLLGRRAFPFSLGGAELSLFPCENDVENCMKFIKCKKCIECIQCIKCTKCSKRIKCMKCMK